MGAPRLDRRRFLRSFFPRERSSGATRRATRGHGMEGFNSEPQDLGHVFGFRFEEPRTKCFNCVSASLSYSALEVVGGDDGVLYFHAVLLRWDLAVNLGVDRRSDR